jgi:ComF family protein
MLYLAACEYPQAPPALSTASHPVVPSMPVATLFARLVDALLPPRCALCGLPSGHRAVCTGCCADLPWLTLTCDRCGLPLPPGAFRCAPGDCELPPGSPVTRLRAPLAYDYPVDRLVQRAKFGRALPVCDALGELLVEGLGPQVPASGLPPLVVPVPLHWQRQHRRGFNQAAEIARVVARATGWPLRPDALRRPRPTREQSALTAEARRRNLRRAFTAAGAIEGRAVVLVDDVITTGATVEGAAAALAAAGVGAIEAWAVARTCRRWPVAGQVADGAPRLRAPGQRAVRSR